MPSIPNRCFFALILAGIALAQSLTLELTSSSAAGDVKIFAKLKNNGPGPVRLFVPNSCLDTTGWKAFDVDPPAPFEGRVYVVSQVADQATPEQLVTINEGDSKTVTHDLNGLYDFGQAVYTFTAKNRIVHYPFGSFPKPKLITFNVATTSVDLTPVRRRRSIDSLRFISRSKGNTMEKRAIQSSDCSPANVQFVNDAVSEAQILASNAAARIQSAGSNALYSQYFGSSSTSDISSTFANVQSNTQPFASEIRCDNGNGGKCVGSVLAYYDIANKETIMCPNFFTKTYPSKLLCEKPYIAVGQRNSRGAVMLDVLLPRDKDIEEEQTGCLFSQSLASSPTTTPLAAKNPDNFSCFAASVYNATSCLAPVPVARTLTMYSDPNYQGTKVDYFLNLPTTCTNVPDPLSPQKSRLVFNDKASSVKIGKGISCTFFLHYNCDGNSVTLEGDTPNLTVDQLNDNISSFTCQDSCITKRALGLVERC